MFPIFILTHTCCLFSITVDYRGSSLGNSSLDLSVFLAGSAIDQFPSEDHEVFDRQSSFSQRSNIGSHPYVIGIILVASAHFFRLA